MGIGRPTIHALWFFILGQACAFWSKPESEKCPFTWTLYKNGELSNGVEVQLPADLHKKSPNQLGRWAAEQLLGSNHLVADLPTALEYPGPGPVGVNGGYTLYDASARRLTHCSQLGKPSAASAIAGSAKDGQGAGALILEDTVSVWVVPPNRWFVFPVGEPGRAVAVPRVSPPRGPAHPITVESVSGAPRVFHLHNFLSVEEADALIAFSEHNTDPLYGLHRSTTGVEHEVAYNDKRTSDNAFDTSSPTAKALKKRALDLMGMGPYDEKLTDGLQVLRYNLTTAYNSHMDYLDDNGGGHDYDSANQGANRFATILFYLSDVEAGGETVFPRGAAVDDGVPDVLDGVSPAPPNMRRLPDGNGTWAPLAAAATPQKGGKAVNDNDDDHTMGHFKRQSWQWNFVKQCQTKLAVRPKKAHAILFYSQDPTGQVDPNSLHGGCPVLAGTKWAANLWIWNKVRLGYNEAPRKAGAKAWDASQAAGRDRLLQKNNDQKGQSGELPTNPDARQAKFRNRSYQHAKAQLFWEDTYFMDFPRGAEEQVNTFKGHEWNVKVDGEVVQTWTVDHHEDQLFVLE